MKKILSVLCVLAFVASFAVIGVSADDAAVSFAAVREPIAIGTTEFTVDIVVTLPADDGDASTVSSFSMLVDIPAGLRLKAEPEKVFTEKGIFTFSQTIYNNPYTILWVSGTDTLPVGTTTTLVTLTFECAAAEVGDSYEIKLTLNPEDMPGTILNVPHENATAVGVTVVVDEPETEATTTAPEVTTADTTTAETTTRGTTHHENVNYETVVVEVTDDNGSVVTDDYGQAVTSVSVITETAAITEAPDTAATNTGVPQGGSSASTGDAVFVVITAMVAALGCAIIVKKASAR